MRTYETPAPLHSHPCTSPLNGQRRSVATGSFWILVPLLLMTGGAIAPPAVGGDITYAIVNYPTLQNGYTVSGTITTDGNTGTLGLVDLTTWDISVQKSGVTQFSLTPSNTNELGVNITATTTALTVSGSGDSLIFEQQSAVSHEIIYLIAWAGPTTNMYESYDIPAQGTPIWASAWPSTNVIASVPEPSTFVQLALGALGAGTFVARARSRHRRAHRG
jgi:PEP-CTERM motif